MNFWCIVDAGQRKNVKHMFSAAIKDIFHFSLIYTSANSLWFLMVPSKGSFGKGIFLRDLGQRCWCVKKYEKKLPICRERTVSIRIINRVESSIRLFIFLRMSSRKATVYTLTIITAMIALDKSPSCQMEEEYIYFCQNTLVIRSILDQAGELFARFKNRLRLMRIFILL